MIDYWKLGIIAAMIATIFGSGWWVGHSKYVAYKAKVEAIATAQEAKIESIEKQQALVNKGIEKEYEAKLALLRNYYANSLHNPSSGAMPSNGTTTGSLDAITAYNLLAGQCAEATQQLVSLQSWLNEQMGIK